MSERHHRPRRRFGQNFLVDANMVDKIVRHIDPRPGQKVVEIGPGQGAMTRPILATGCDLTVIEIDRDLAASLRDSPEFAGLTVIEIDALKLKLGRFEQPVRLVGNLPYNISTPILFWAMGQLEHVVDMHFMLQKEVVDRMAAEPGGREYGRLTVMLQVHCQVEALFGVPPHVFRPAPKVDSAIVRLTPRRCSYDPQLLHSLDRIVRAAFAARRKTLGNGLKKTLGRELIAAAGVDPTVRPEKLTVSEFLALAEKHREADQNVQSVHTDA